MVGCDQIEQYGSKRSPNICLSKCIFLLDIDVKIVGPDTKTIHEVNVSASGYFVGVR